MLTRKHDHIFVIIGIKFNELATQMSEQTTLHAHLNRFFRRKTTAY